MATYTVQRGDSLQAIAKKFYGDSSLYQQLAEYNGLKNANALDVGQKLNIPDRADLENGASAWHNYGDGKIWWRLTKQGVEIKGKGLIKEDKYTKRAADIWRKYEPMITTASKKYGVPIPAIIATISTESSGNPKAYRYEPLFYTRYIKDQKEWKESPYHDYPRRIAASYGLVQIMYTTAYNSAGFRGKPEDLYDPAANINAGAAYIASAYQVKQHGWDPPKIACAYNAGSVRATKANDWGMYHHPDHLERWIPAYNGAIEVTGAAGAIPETSVSVTPKPTTPSAPAPTPEKPTTPPASKPTSPPVVSANVTMRLLFSSAQGQAWKPMLVDMFKHNGAELGDPISFRIAAVKPFQNGYSFEIPNIAKGTYDLVLTDAASGSVMTDFAEVEIETNPTVIDVGSQRGMSRDIVSPDAPRATLRLRFPKTGQRWKPVIVDLISTQASQESEPLTVTSDVAPPEQQDAYLLDIPNVLFGSYAVDVTEADTLLLLQEIAGIEVNRPVVTLDLASGKIVQPEIPKNLWERLHAWWNTLWQV
ncbi:hypothetical protein U14_03766 [Candidatus Moduliflexus flocculans]|uniref:LysM domain-containing protein n=1 Tax=Candidatus Moduliflexus flocculans TaxID=1499966 RepID=A0A081BQ49_9BACT|nr:hypothetical protein U14_03766 [Candidatus Moduliflexus flocculans]